MDDQPIREGERSEAEAPGRPGTSTARRPVLDTLRRRVLPAVFLVVLTALGVRTCSTQTAHVEVVFDLGAAASRVRAFRVDVFPAGATRSVVVLDRRYGSAGAPDAPKFEAQIDDGRYEFWFTVRLAGGVVRFQRDIDVTDRARISVPVESELGER